MKRVLSEKYMAIVAKSQAEGLVKIGDGSIEQHHILPRAWGGTDDPENLVNMRCHDHFLAHRQLAIDNPGSGMELAFWKMCTDGRHDATPEEYEEAKILYVQSRKGRPAWNRGVSMSAEARAKLSASTRGVSRGPKNENWRRALSKSHRGKKLSESHLAAVAEARRRRGPQSEESKEKARIAVSQLKWCNDGVRNYRRRPDKMNGLQPGKLVLA